MPCLHRAALAGGDDVLADLITLAMWTGCRIEEICSLRRADVDIAAHSITVREGKTVATLSENAGVSENVAADTLDHEKPRITYGLYSGGASLAVKAAAIEKLTYPGDRANPQGSVSGGRAR